MVEGVRLRDEKDMAEIDGIIGRIEGLSPVARIGEKIMEIGSNPESSLSELVEVVRYDQGMTANLLRICNSSYFGLSKKIVSLNQAVSFLGMDRVVSFVMMGNCSDNLRHAQPGYDLNEGELWRYSVSSALMSQGLAEKRNLNDIPLIFTSALLKDLGKVVLNSYVKDSAEAISRAVENRGLSFIEAEREVIGIDHAEIGARVAEKWNFSPAMVNIIRNHHHPEISPADDLSLPVVYLADCICMMMGRDVGFDGLAYRYYQNVMDRLHFSDTDLQKTMVGFREKFRMIEALISLSGG